MAAGDDDHNGPNRLVHRSGPLQRSAPVAARGLLRGLVVLVRLADRLTDPVEHLRQVRRSGVPFGLAGQVRLLRGTSPGGNHRLELVLQVLERADQGAVRLLDARLASLEGFESYLDLGHVLSKPFDASWVAAQPLMLPVMLVKVCDWSLSCVPYVVCVDTSAPCMRSSAALILVAWLLNASCTPRNALAAWPPQPPSICSISPFSVWIRPCTCW